VERKHAQGLGLLKQKMKKALKAFSSPEPFSLDHSLKIRLWVRRRKGNIWLASQRTSISQKLSNFRLEKFFYQNMSTQILCYFLTLVCGNCHWCWSVPIQEHALYKLLQVFLRFRFRVSQGLCDLVPRACDPREGTWGSGINRFREKSDWPLTWNAHGQKCGTCACLVQRLL
jgi:hypothetical protein